jgi:hypothetical protein
MLSYTTPATIKIANVEAERITGQKLAGHEPRGNRTEELAKAHAIALARRIAG